jgi:hypothetical protein
MHKIERNHKQKLYQGSKTNSQVQSGRKKLTSNVICTERDEIKGFELENKMNFLCYVCDNYYKNSTLTFAFITKSLNRVLRSICK